MDKAVDTIQRRFADYAYEMEYEALPADVIHAAKARVIDTLGALIAGFFGEPCRIARSLAAQMLNANGATIIGTRMMAAPDLAAFINATTSRYAELTDAYHRPGGQGHPSDVIMPVLAVAEHAGLGGRAFITGIVLAYEVFLRINDEFHNRAGYDHTIYGCLASAVAAGKLLGLSRDQLSHCISMAVVPNNTLRQAREGHTSMFKAAATGYAARAGVYAALLARAGMEGPHLPFEGKAGWNQHVAKERIVIGAMGGGGTPFKILETLIKNRPAAGVTASAIIAAEKLAPVVSVAGIKQVTVEVHKYAKDVAATGEHRWHLDTRENADHSIPYLTAAALMDGAITLRSYDAVHLSNPRLHALMQKIAVNENAEFTAAFNREPQEHRARVTVMMDDGKQFVGETGGDEDDMSGVVSDTRIEEKFRGLTEDTLGAKRVQGILNRLWRLDDMESVAEIPRAFVIA